MAGKKAKAAAEAKTTALDAFVVPRKRKEADAVKPALENAATEPATKRVVSEAGTKAGEDEGAQAKELAETEFDVNKLSYRDFLRKEEKGHRALDALLVYEPKGVGVLEPQVGKSPRTVFSQNEAAAKAFEWVFHHFVVPEDMDSAATQYGSRTGLCHEERVLGAFESGQLKPKPSQLEKVKGLKMCRECNSTAHFLWDCPQRVLQRT
jgi:hypothetical protein